MKRMARAARREGREKNAKIYDEAVDACNEISRLRDLIADLEDPRKMEWISQFGYSDDVYQKALSRFYDLVKKVKDSFVRVAQSGDEITSLYFIDLVQECGLMRWDDANGMWVDIAE